jgi:hypothetical protein
VQSGLEDNVGSVGVSGMVIITMLLLGDGMRLCPYDRCCDLRWAYYTTAILLADQSKQDGRRVCRLVYGFAEDEGKITVRCMLFPGLENRDYGRGGPAALTMRHPSIRKSWH